MKRVDALWAVKRRLPALERAFRAKFWFDEAYREFLLKPAYWVAKFCRFADAEGVDAAVNAVGRGTLATSRGSGRTDVVVVDGAVRGTGWVMLAGGSGVSRLQSGRVRTYLAVGVALVAIVLILVVPRWF